MRELRVAGRPGQSVLLALAMLLGGSCGHRVTLPAVPNQLPEVSLTQAPATSVDPYYYAYEIRWAGWDPDGRVVAYEYAVDPPTTAGAETSWVRTRENRHTFLFRSPRPDTTLPDSDARGFHVFAIRAVDDDGARSQPVSQSFTSYTVAPSVAVVQPVPSKLLIPLVPPTTSIRWSGLDPDGSRSTRPLRYKWKLFPESGTDFPFQEATLRPDSLRRAYAPGFAGWDSVGGDTTSVRLERLIPESKYLFVVVAFDEAGAYSPVFNLDTNMLYFVCSYTGANGPRLTLWNEFFNYTYDAPGWSSDPSRYIHLEVPAGREVDFQWSATAAAGTRVRRYRWCMDIARLDDETPRSDQRRDMAHWSAWSLFITSATVGPFTGGEPGGAGEQHLFYVEAEDENGLRSLGIVDLRVVRTDFVEDLLFVDDTRLAPDQRVSPFSDSLRAPAGQWPSAAELDTLLFARGGVRWRYYPAGTRSAPGFFAGYRFDTLGTRGLGAAGVPLSVLGRYRHVVWITNRAMEWADLPGSPLKPQPFLRWGSSANRANTLANYSFLGGEVWLQGGGAAYNGLIPWNQEGNDELGGLARVFSREAGELAPGRFMYDLAHWRSELTTYRAQRARRRDGVLARPGPDWSLLPALLDWHNLDPVPPLRGPGSFYSAEYEAEYLTLPNDVRETRAGGVAEQVLDTLYVTYGASYPDSLPLMTWYHGDENGGFVFSGFPLWYFRRADATRVGDFVLQQLWGLQRSPAPGASLSSRAAGQARRGTPAGARTGPSRRLDPRP